MDKLNFFKILFLILNLLSVNRGKLFPLFIYPFLVRNIINFIKLTKAQQLLSDYVTSYKLKKDTIKLTEYDSWIRPVINTSTTTNISFGLSIMKLIEIVKCFF
jgi:hypothetical protein